MLPRFIARSDTVAEPAGEHNAVTEDEYRDAEHEYEYEKGRKPDPTVHPMTACAVFQMENQLSRPADPLRHPTYID